MTPQESAILDHAIRIQTDGLPHAKRYLQWADKYIAATLEALELAGELKRPAFTLRELSLGCDFKE